MILIGYKVPISAPNYNKVPGKNISEDLVHVFYVCNWLLQIKGPPIEFITLDDVTETLAKLSKGTQRGRAVVKFDT